MKAVHFFLACVFLLFAFVQLNDPDPIHWILIYLFMAAISGLAFFNRFYSLVLWGGLGIFFLYSLVYTPGILTWLQQSDKSQLFDNVAKMEHLYIEESREFLGLFICELVLGWYLWLRRKRLSKDMATG